MPTIETIRRIRVQQTSEGGAAVRADLLATADAQTKLGDATASAAVVTDLASRKQLSAASAFDRLRMSVDASYKAMVAEERGLNTINRALQQNATDAATAGRVMELLGAKFSGAAAEVKAFEAAQRAAAQATIQAREAQEAAARAYQQSLNKRLGVGGGGGGDDRAADFEAAAAAGDRLRAKYDQVFAAAQRYAATVKEVTEAERAGILTTDIASEARLKATRSYNDQISVLERIAQVQKESAQRSVNSQTIVPDRAGDIAAYGAELNRLQAEFDPVFRATQNYESYVERLTTALNTGAIGQDVFNARLGEAKVAFDDQIAKINGVVEVQTKATRSTSELRAAWAQLGDQGRSTFQNIQASNKLGSLSNMGGTVRDDAANASVRAQVEAAAARAAADAESYAAGLAKERAALVPLFAVTQQFEAIQTKANKALAEGVISQDEHAAAIGRAKNTLLAQTNEIRKADEANQRMAKGVGLSAYGWQNLSFQVNDVVTSIASGISPMQTLAQQGGQIFQVLQGGQGGVKGALLGIGQGALSVAAAIGPVGIALGVATVAALAGAAAFSSYSTSQMALTRNLAGVGRASGVTVDQINAIATASAAAGGVSTREFRSMAGEFASTGKIGGEMLALLGQTTKDYAATTGQDLPAAQKALAEAFADPSKGAEALDKQLGFLNDTTRENIQRLALQGDRLGAQMALFEAYQGSLKKSSELTGFWAKTTEAAGNIISNAWDKIGKAIDQGAGEGSPEERLDYALKAMERAKAAKPGPLAGLFGGPNDGGITSAQKRIDEARAAIQKRDQETAKSQQDATSKRIGDIVRGLNPFDEQLKQIDARAKDIRDHLADIPFDERGRARQAMEGLLTQAKQLRADMEAGGASYADAIRAAQFQQRTVGFTPQGLSAAQINENAANKRLDAFRNASTNSDQGAFEKQIASIETERKTLLDALEKNTTLQQNQIGGAFSRMSAGVQAQIIAAGNQFAKVPAALIAGIADKESGGNANIGGTKVLGANGQPSTSAYGLGQITKGTAAEAVKNGYLPPTFDRTDPNQGAAGIAGVFQMKLDQAGGDQFKALKNYYGSKSDAANTAYANDVLRRAGQMGDPSTQAQGRDVDTYNRALRDQKDLLANTVENYGKNGLALEANAEATRRYNALLDAGVPANEALAASIRGLATQTATAAQQMKLTQFASDTGFQREQLGRSAPAAAAYSQARSLVGDTNSAGAQFVIAEAQTLDALKQAKDVSSGAFSGIITDLSHGTSVANSFASALSRIGDKLISIGTDALFSSAFGSLLGGGGKGSSGGGFGGILSSIFGGGFDPFKGFAGGGYTGAGGKYEPAGIVHRGEYVIDSGTVSRIGRGFFDGLRGYADGGFVDIADTRAPITPVPAVAANDQGGPQRGGDVYQIDARGSTLTQAEMTSAVQRAIAANNIERDRTSKDRNEMLRRIAF